MSPVPPHRSVVTWLTAASVAGAIVLVTGIALLQRHHADRNLQREVARRVTLTLRAAQDALRIVDADRRNEALQEVSATLLSDPTIRAIRATIHGKHLILGNWPDAPPYANLLPLQAPTVAEPIALDGIVIVHAPFHLDGNMQLLECAVDVQGERQAAHHRALQQAITHAIMVALLAWFGLYALRRWWAQPMNELSELIAAPCGPESFRRLAQRRQADEFTQFATKLADMFAHCDTLSQELRQTRRTAESLYQFAPVAMLTLNHRGEIVDANRRAAEVLRVDSEAALVGKVASDWVRLEDRPLLRQSLERLEVSSATRCELRLATPHRQIDAVAEFIALRDEDGHLDRVRLSLLDITASRELQRELENKRSLLELVVDHISDAIVLVDVHGRVAAHNQRLATLLHRPYHDLVGEPYSAAEFWEPLGIVHRHAFLHRLKQMEKDPSRQTQERIVTRGGVYLFQSIPVHNVARRPLGRLWVVQEITSQEQSQRLAEQQAKLLVALRQLTQRLSQIGELDELLTVASDELYEIFGVDTVGIAVRYANARRARQVIHRGAGPYLLEPHAALTEQLACRLMPRFLAQDEVTFWPELPRHESWSAAWQRAGLSCVAGIAMRGRNETQGVLWIAQRGGERVESYHLHLLETLAPVLAARIEMAQVVEQQTVLGMVDTTTELASRKHLLTLAGELCRRRRSYALVLLRWEALAALRKQRGDKAVDTLLQRTATLMRTSVRSGTLVAHLEPGTFALLCPGAQREDGVALADRLQHELLADTNPAIAQVIDCVHLTTAVAHCPSDADTALQLLRHVERNLPARHSDAVSPPPHNNAFESNGYTRNNGAR